VLSRLELTKCVEGKLTSVRAECSNTSGLHLLKMDWARLKLMLQHRLRAGIWLKTSLSLF